MSDNFSQNSEWVHKIVHFCTRGVTQKNKPGIFVLLNISRASCGPYLLTPRRYTRPKWKYCNSTSNTTVYFITVLCRLARRQTSNIKHQTSDVKRQTSSTSNIEQQSQTSNNKHHIDVWCLMFDVGRLMFDVWCLVSDVWCLMFGVWSWAVRCLVMALLRHCTTAPWAITGIPIKNPPL